MGILFDSSDGSFEIIIGPDDPVLAEHNVKGTVILRETRGGGMYIVEKDFDEILEDHFIGPPKRKYDEFS